MGRDANQEEGWRGVREAGPMPSEELWRDELDSQAGEGGDNTRNDEKIIINDNQPSHTKGNENKIYKAGGILRRGYLLQRKKYYKVSYKEH